jgi:hypothetical protein
MEAQALSSDSGGIFDGISSFFTNLFSGMLNGSDPVIGTWDFGIMNLTMQFDANGTAVLRDSGTGNYTTGRWEKVSDGLYRLIARSGTRSPILSYDPIQDALYTDDLSTVLFRAGGAR